MHYTYDARVETTNTCEPEAGTVTKVPASYWDPATTIRRLPTGVVWVAFDSGAGAPWDTADLRVIV